jgi:hypothetical protein
LPAWRARTAALLVDVAERLQAYRPRHVHQVLADVADVATTTAAGALDVAAAVLVLVPL